jgi:hypothetical protein
MSTFVVACRQCGQEFTPSSASIKAGSWKVCPSCSPKPVGETHCRECGRILRAGGRDLCLQCAGLSIMNPADDKEAHAVTATPHITNTHTDVLAKARDEVNETVAAIQTAAAALDPAAAIAAARRLRSILYRAERLGVDPVVLTTQEKES